MRMKRSVRRFSFLLSAVFLATLMTGFFHGPPEIKVKSLKQIAGTYKGSFTTTGGREIDGITIVINADGSYYTISPRGKRPGKASVEDGMVILRREGAGPTTCVFRENKEKRVMIGTSERGEGEYTLVK